MRYFCTALDQHDLAGSLALHRSLLEHAGDFQLLALCMDEAIAAALQSRDLPRLRLIPVAELARQYPPLAAAKADRTEGEFQLTAVPWLFRHLLPQLPPGELLTFVAGDFFFFSSPQPYFDEIGQASVVLSPFRYAAEHIGLERYGKFNNGWIALRHDATGLACAAEWADQCADWCFAQAEPQRYGNQKYLDAWPARFPEVVCLKHPGINLAPWNVGGVSVVASPAGPRVNGEPLVCYHFHFLRHLARQLYEPGLHRFGVTPSPALRELVYLPYLRQLAGDAPDAPEIVPPARADDPRLGLVLPQLLERASAAEKDRAAALQALDRHRAEAQRTIGDLLAARIASERYTREVEVERDQQRQAFFDTRQKLLAFHEDLVRNVAYIKTLHAEAELQKKAAVDREAYITNLNEQLARKASGVAGPDLGEFFRAFHPFSRDLRRALVAQYHPRLLPAILALASSGVSVEILGSPPELAGPPRGGLHFWAETLWDWLGGINSLFNEAGYLQANPDVRAAVAAGSVSSGWDHFQRFGQHEGRPAGSVHFRSGLPDADAVLFDSADAGPIVPCLFGRMQPHQQLFISSCFNPATVWLPPETGRVIVFGDLLCCPQPPRTWIGPRLPSAFPVPQRTAAGVAEIYPAKPCQQALWPRISVVTVSFNQAAYLEETLRSVLDQNYPNLEYIVVDGGSTDGSVEILQKYSSRLTWWVSEKDHGQSHALNKGFAKSTGSILTWLNSDDRLAPGSLFTVAQQFLLHDPDVISGRCARVTEHDVHPHHVHRSVLSFGQLQALPLAELLDLDRCWLQGWFFHQPEVFFQRRIFDRAGGQLREDLYYSMDYDLWVRMARAGARILPLPEILALFRAHSRQKTGGSDLPCLPELRAVNAAHRAPATT